MIWTYPISHFLEKHWYDSFLHLYQRAPCKRFFIFKMIAVHMLEYIERVILLIKFLDFFQKILVYFIFYHFHGRESFEYLIE